MCDTLVALGDSTVDGSVLLAKNSDREPNEAQVLTYLPRLRHEPGSRLRCTYIDIPEVPETYQVLLSRPFWMWGAEMGVNECGVAIGNEAVFTREPYNKGPALTGMDLLRLALERAGTAQNALEVIVDLLEQYGQGGNCGYRHKLYYHNSYIIADPVEAWVLETVGRHWVAERVQGVRTISNGLTIGSQPDRVSNKLARHAAEKGWARDGSELHLSRCCSDPIMTRLDGCRARQARTTSLLTAESGRISVRTLMAALRDHGRGADGPDWGPARGLLMDRVCVHASLWPTRPSQSVGSLVAHLTRAGPVAWVTGTSAPCTGLFKPIFLGSSAPELGREPSGTADPDSLWWAHERLHRMVIRDYAARLAAYRSERDALEWEFLAEATALVASGAGGASDLAAFTERCFQRATEATQRWLERVSHMPATRRLSPAFSLAWTRFDRQARFGGSRVPTPDAR
ncbi:MAG TPA: C69 family dipeptidase [Anaerolineae bacterium]|nr:C69 family dipeptidase [Anaerolineae bacterium]